VKPAFLEGALRRATGNASLRLTDTRPVGGGCIHEAARLSTTAGEFFAKWNARCPPDLFPSEAAGLEALRSAGSELHVPRVVAAARPESGHPGYLILEYLAPGRARRHDEVLGRGLASIHRKTAPGFGFDSDTYCGSTRQDNAACATWAEFYAKRRLRPMIDALGLDGDERRPFARLVDRLPDILPTASTASLVHGDLWAGNVLETAAGPALVDPACAYADREMEFGITTLFGGLSARAWAAYEEAWPLPAGWRERNPLYQLYHLLNHALLFGGGYMAQARSAAAHFA